MVLEPLVNDGRGSSCAAGGLLSGIIFSFVSVRFEPQALRAKDEAFRPFTRQIDAIEAQVGELEQVVGTLDAYTRKLEARFNAVRSAQH